MQLCSCGFANADEAIACVACGRALTTTPSDASSASSTTGEPPAPASASDAEAAPCCAPNLVLENARGGTISIPAPGGLLGRAGDFEPDSFSPRVSGVHALLSCDNKGRWTIEHLGRNGSSVERAGVWITLRTGQPHPLFGGETLKLADMVFRVSLAVAPAADAATGNASTLQRTAPAAKAPCAASGVDDAATPSPDAVVWSIRCPVCGTEHAVASAEERVARCSFCQDPLDARQIARTAPRALPRA